jgi:methionine synthase II (cobalamin-independent)
MFATISGGYPFTPPPGLPDDLVSVRRRLAAGDASAADLDAVADAWVTDVVAEQASSGLSMAVDGWARWPGVDPSATTPLDVARALLADRITPDDLVRAWRWADDGIDVMVKQVLPGPWSAARALAANPADRAPIARDLEDRLVAAGSALRASLVPVLQFDEPAIPAIGADEAAWDDLAETLQRLCDRLPGIHRSLAITDGAAHPAGHTRLAALPFESLLVDVVTAGVDGWRLIHALPPETGVVVGAADSRSPAPDDPEMLIWAATLAAESGDRGHVRVGVTTSGSLAGLERLQARRKLESLGMAVKLSRMGPMGLVARRLQEDPATCRIGSLRRLVADHLAALASVDP